MVAELIQSLLAIYNTALTRGRGVTAQKYHVDVNTHWLPNEAFLSEYSTYYDMATKTLEESIHNTSWTYYASE